MNPKLSLLTAVSLYLLFSLNACPPANTDEERHADFWVGTGGSRGASGYVTNGYGWKPNSNIEISIWDEPNGPDSVNAEWKKIHDVKVTSRGDFGFEPTPIFYPVSRKFCGDGRGQSVMWRAVNLTTGTMKMRPVANHLYFTRQPCP